MRSGLSSVNFNKAWSVWPVQARASLPRPKPRDETGAGLDAGFVENAGHMNLDGTRGTSKLGRDVFVRIPTNDARKYVGFGLRQSDVANRQPKPCVDVRPGIANHDDVMA